jgi:ABC-type polysaccharide/polyol phosphate export permease
MSNSHNVGINVLHKYKNVIGNGWILALRNIRIQILEHALGYAWTLIIPMLYAACYFFIKRELKGADMSGSEAGWDVLRAFSGIMIVQSWMLLVVSMAGMIRHHKGMLRGLNISTISFVLAIAFEGVIAIAIRAILIIAAIPILGLDLPDELSAWLWFAVCLIMLYLSAIMVGLFLAPWATLYSDIFKGISSMRLPLILISPIFYPAIERTDSALYLLNLVNPIASPLAVLANTLRGEELSLYLMPMLVWGGLSVVLFVWSLKKLRCQVPILLERMGS